MDDDSGDVVGGEPVRMALDAVADWKPCVVWRGSNTSPGVPAATTRSVIPTCMSLAEEVGRQVVLRDVARRIEELAVDDGQLRAGRDRRRTGAASR